MPTDDDYMQDPELMAIVDHAAIAELGKALDGVHEADDPTKTKLRAAAIEICQRAGILDVLKAVSANGVLRPPPIWPEADIVPVGGGPGWLRVAIRSMASNGVVEAHERIKIQGKPTQDQIGNAYDRGYFRLRKAITKAVSVVNR